MSSSNPFESPKDNEKSASDQKSPIGIAKLWFLAGLIVAFLVMVWLSKSYLNLETLAQQETYLKEFYATNPSLVLAIAFTIYVLMAGLSIPGATIFSLVYAWFFGFTTALILVSFASTAGATLAFLSSRYLLRDFIQARFGERLKVINEAFDREGNFYLFLMRLIPAFPFFVVNLVMGLTRIKAVTFWWVSQIGMLAGTAVYIYAGSRIPDLQTLKTDGIQAVLTPTQLTQIAIALALLGLFPIVARKIVGRITGKQNPVADAGVDR